MDGRAGHFDCMTTKITSNPMAVDELPRLMSTAETAKYLGIAEGTLHNWRSADAGPDYSMIGRRLRYSADDVDAWRRAQVVRTRETA